MKYNLIDFVLGRETDTVDGKYSVPIEITVQSEDEFIPPFIKTIVVESSNKLSGFQVDKQRLEAVNNFVAEISK